MALKRSIQSLSVAGTLCLLIAAALYLLNGWFFNDAGYYYQQIENNLHRQITLAESEQEITLQKLAGRPDMPFSVLPPDLQHQYYIFRNRNLWYWSDYHYVPNYENLAGTYQYRLLNLPEGQFVVLKTEFAPSNSPADQFEIFMLIPLTSRMVLEHNGKPYNRHIFISPDFIVNPPGVSRQESQASANPGARIPAGEMPGADSKVEGADTLASGDAGQESGTIYTPDGLALFEVSIGKSYLNGPDQFKLFTLIFLFLGIGIWVVVLFQYSKRRLWRARIAKRLLVLAIGLAVLRALMLFFSFPYALYPLALLIRNIMPPHL